MSNVTHCYQRQTSLPLCQQSLILHDEPQPIHSPHHTSEEVAHETLAEAMIGAAKATSKREERNVKMQHEVCHTSSSSSPFNGMDKARNSIVRKFTEKLCWQGDQSNGLRVREVTAMRALATPQFDRHPKRLSRVSDRRHRSQRTPSIRRQAFRPDQSQT